MTKKRQEEEQTNGDEEGAGDDEAEPKGGEQGVWEVGAEPAAHHERRLLPSLTVIKITRVLKTRLSRKRTVVQVWSSSGTCHTHTGLPW